MRIAPDWVSGPIAPTLPTAALTSRVPDFSNCRVSGTDWPGWSGCLSPIIMTCSPPGFSDTGVPGGRSIAVTSRIFMTPPSLVISCSCAFSAAGLVTPVSRSPVGDSSVK